MRTHSITRLLLTGVAWFGLQTVTLAQSNSNYCGSDAVRKKLIAEHPEILQQESDLEQFTKQFEADYNPNGRTGPYIIPIVFHIIHQGGSENISDAQVYDQMRILNEDFNKGNADTADVVATFKPAIGNAGIEFRLANIDPWGNYTTGIEHIYSCQTYMGNDFSKMNNWPRDKYLNVWVVRSMENGVAGYAYYPGSVDALYSVPSRDGVIILQASIGSIGTGTPGNSRALTHEIGHYLNLKHVWGDTNEPNVSCGDDDVQDTPPTKGSAVGVCNKNLAFCHPPDIENVQNFMDYSYCSKMFSEGQVVRMIAALNSNKSDRNNLYSPSNLAATGTDDTFYNASAAKAEFVTSKRYVCLGTPVTLLDASYNGEITDYYWEFPTGTPPTSIAKNPQVTFSTIGWQPIKLTITGPLGTSVKENNTLVYVANDLASYVAPFHEGFEDPNVFASNEWASVNYDNNYTSFRHTGNTSHWGSACVMLNNYDSRNDHDIDELVSPGFDLSGLANTDLKLSFYYSLASWNQNFSDLTDSIAVLATSNCGASNWVNIYKKGGSNVVNAGYQEGYFTPTSAPAFWRYVSINLANTWKQPNVRFKFQIYSAVKGNNFYIDDINVGNMVISGVEPVTSINEISVFPNPASNQASIEINLAETSDMVIEATDITGKLAMKIFEGKMNDGITRIDVNTSSLSKGIYLVNVKAGNSVRRKKLVIE